MTKTALLLIGGGILLAVAAGGQALSGNLSIIQLWNLAKAAGFSGADAVIAVAVALAESGGDPEAYGDRNIPVEGAASLGLWQINTYYHPEFGPDFSVLMNPQRNAEAAFSVYRAAGNSFTPWTTFKNGAYASFVNQISSTVGA